MLHGFWEPPTISQMHCRAAASGTNHTAGSGELKGSGLLTPLSSKAMGCEHKTQLTDVIKRDYFSQCLMGRAGHLREARKKINSQGEFLKASLKAIRKAGFISIHSKALREAGS